MAQALAAYERHLVSERDLTGHTVRAYVGDIRGMLEQAARLGHTGVDTRDVRTLRSWLATHQTLGKARTTMARRATAFTIAGLSSLGLPATAGFVAEFLTFLGAWQSPSSWWLFPGVIGAYLTSVYVLRVAKQIFWGPKPADPHFQHLPDAQGPEWAALIILVLTIFGIV